MKYKVVVDITPRTIPGTKNCHRYMFGIYTTKREASSIAQNINTTNCMGKAYVEADKK